MANQIVLTDGKEVFLVPEKFAGEILKAIPTLRQAPVGLDADEVARAGGITHGHISNFPLKSVMAPRRRK